MNPKVLNALNLLSVIAAFLIADAPNLIKSLAPYPRVCVFVGVALALVSSFGRLVGWLKAFYGVKVDSSKSDNGEDPPVPPRVAATILVLFTSLFLLTGTARAQELKPAFNPQIGFAVGDIGSCQLATAVSALQVNLKTGDTKRVAFLGGFGCIFHNWVVPYGATVYVGESVSSTEGSSPQANLLFQLTDWIAFGPGVQLRKGNGVYFTQGLFSVVATLNLGGTPMYVRDETVKAERAVRASLKNQNLNP